MPNEVTTKNNAVAVSAKDKLATAAAKIADFYLADVTNLNAAVGMPMTEETRRCAVNFFLELCSTYGVEAVRAIPPAQVVSSLQFVTLNGLDIFNGQVYVDVRKDKNGNIVTMKATAQGTAYEIMVRRFGVDVVRLHPARVVHEGDEFQMPQFDGTKATNVIFRPTLKGLDSKAIAVYYLIEKTDGNLDFAIATREGVAKNLMAQILNATLRDSSVNRYELMKHMEGLTLEELLNDKMLEKYISPAYKSPASRESMIIQKMKKNALLHYTRDLGSKAYAAVADQIEDEEIDDMVSKTVVSVDESDVIDAKPAQKKPAIKDFTVSDDGEVKTEEPAPAQKPQEEPATKVKEEKVEETPAQPAEEPKKPAPAAKDDSFDFFDTGDL